MTHEERKRFTVITNHEMEAKEKERNNELEHSYQTNPLRERLVKFVNNEHKFSVEDLLKW